MAEKRDASGDVSTDVVGASTPRTVNDGVDQSATASGMASRRP